jgi:hypothetical protein
MKIRSVLRYMTDLKIGNNEEIGHYGQTLLTYFTKVKARLAKKFHTVTTPMAHNLLR